MRQQVRRSSLINVGTSQLQTEAAGTVVTWFYQAARATALSFAVAVFAHFYVAMGATTRDQNVNIPVETVTPPVVKDTALVRRWGEYGVARGRGQVSALVSGRGK